MLRIISGKYKGRKLAKSDHLKNLRPTKDSARENLFNLLTSNKNILATGFDLKNSNILDICCGSGLVAFEAISRGAKSAVLIDNNLSHLDLARQNQNILQIADITKLLNLNVKNLPQNDVFFDLVFIDPPYDEDYNAILNNLLSNKWIQDKTIVVIEMSNIAQKLISFEEEFKLNNLINRLELLEKRKYGSSVFYFFISKN